MGFWEDHAADRDGALCRLYQFDWSTVKRWTDASTPIATSAGDDCGAYLWTRRPIQSPSGITSRQSDVGSATIEMGNADNVISAILFAGGTAGIQVHIWEAGFLSTNFSARPDGVRKIFWGRLKIPSAPRRGDASVVHFQLGPPYDFNSKMAPIRRLSDLLRA